MCVRISASWATSTSFCKYIFLRILSIMFSIWDLLLGCSAQIYFSASYSHSLNLVCPIMNIHWCFSTNANICCICNTAFIWPVYHKVHWEPQAITPQAVTLLDLLRKTRSSKLGKSVGELEDWKAVAKRVWGFGFWPSSDLAMSQFPSMTMLCCCRWLLFQRDQNTLGLVYPFWLKVCCKVRASLLQSGCVAKPRRQMPPGGG